MGNQELANSNAFDTDEIRQIQALIVLCSCLPPDGKLREVLQHALSLPHESVLARLTPVSDPSFNGLKTWLETLWTAETLSADEQRLVKFQQSQENIDAAIRELRAVGQRIGLKFGVPAFSEQRELSQVQAQ